MGAGDEDRSRVVRELRQRLEGLGRAGLTHVPRPSPDAALRALGTGLAAPKASGPEGLPPPAQGGDREGGEAMGRATRKAAAAAPARSLFEGAEERIGASGPRPSREDVERGLAVIASEVAGCPRCAALVESRTHTVPGEGNPEARLVFIGEAPGAEEDRTGRPFVGRAGQLLNDMIGKGMGLAREDVFIANTLKCRPPANRVPLPDELANCREYLDRQLELIRPEFLCLLGKTAALALLDLPPATTMGGLRGKWFTYRGIRTMVTFHPAYLLRNPPAKKDAWEDLKMLMAEMGLKPPGRGPA
jgi:DNA polymerase